MRRGGFLRWVAWAALLLAACDGGSRSDTSTSVVYAVVGTACSADVTYQDLSGVPTVLAAQLLPWHFAFDIPAKRVDGFPLSLVATNDCSTGSITANVVVNGALYGSNTNATPNGIATVQLSLF